MKKIILLIASLIIIQSFGLSQSCLPEGITFTTQEEIDNFQTNNPNCTEIEGSVIVSGSDEITNLNGLNVLTAIGGMFRIYSCSVLTSLEGLDNITSIGGDLDIYGNNSLLSNLTGLDNLAFIGGGLNINGTETLISLTGLENVTTIVGYLQISLNDALINLTGLDNVTSIGEEIWIGENTALTNLIGLESLITVGENIEIYTSNLTSLTGLDNLTTVGGCLQISYSNNLSSISSLANLTSIGGYIEIYYNEALSSLTGLDNIEAGSITDIGIGYNSSLSTCEVKSVCDYLANPNGNTDISDNASGCNSPEEVEEACAANGVYENHQKIEIFIYPNPATNEIFIESRNKVEVTEINIYNTIGQIEIIRKGLPERIDVSKLNKGVYFVELVSNKTKFRKKLIVN